MNNMGYVFISYSTKDSEYANALRKAFSEHGIKTWMAPGDIPAGSTYAGVITKAIKDADCLILLLTDHSQNSIWVDKEVERALAYGKAIIPIALDSIKLNDNFELYLGNKQIVLVKQLSAASEDFLRIICQVRALTNAGTDSTPNLYQKKNLDEVEQEFVKTLESLVYLLNDLAKALQVGDHELYNTAASRMEKVLRKILYWGQTHTENTKVADAAKRIINQYNTFTTSLNQFTACNDPASPIKQARWQSLKREHEKLAVILINLLNNEFGS